MADGRRRLWAREPDLSEVRGERHLLVWGDLAQWLVVDAELRDFLQRFDGRRPIEGIVADHAAATGQAPAVVAATSRPVIEQLVAKGILTADPSPPRREPEPLRIANLTLNLTNLCNLDCRWCYTRGHDSEEAPIEALMDRLAQAGDLLAPSCTFIILGGEPTARPQRLVRALARAAEIFTTPTLVSTNGTLLAPALVAALAEQPVEIQVSLDGASAERHDAVRGAGSFARALGGIERLRAAGIPTLISMVYDRDSLDELEPYLDLARALGVAEARFFPMRQIGAGGGANRELAPDQAATFRRLLDILDRRPELRGLLRRDYFSIQHAVCRFATVRSGCGVGRRVALIDADGTVYPCPNQVEPHHALGDLRRDSLRDIFLDSPGARALRERFQVDNYPVCRACAVRHWCAGDCRGEVLACGGQPGDPSPHCAELEEVFREILWLLADRDPRLGATTDGAGGSDPADAFL